MNSAGSDDDYPFDDPHGVTSVTEGETLEAANYGRGLDVAMKSSPPSKHIQDKNLGRTGQGTWHLRAAPPSDA